MENMQASTLHQLSRQLREIALRTTGNVGEDRVSVSDLAIVEDVSYHPQTSIGEIAQRTGLAQSLVSRTVATMREAGLFVTDVDPADRRKSLVGVAPSTRLQLFEERGSRLIRNELMRTVEGIDDQAADRVIAMLEEISAVLGSREPNERRDVRAAVVDPAPG